jgi:hypothetical protein
MVGRAGLGVLILQLAAAVATANDVGLELGVAAPAVADHHAGLVSFIWQVDAPTFTASDVVMGPADVRLGC